MKIIRIDDDNYKKLKYLASNDDRSMANVLKRVLDKALNEGGGSSSSPPSTKNKVPAENIPNNSVGNGAFVPRPPDPLTGYPCCLKSTPCKHWTYDGADGMWVNSLTGKRRVE